MLFKITAEIVFVSEIQDRSDFFHTHDRKMDEFFSLQNNPLVDQYRRRLMKENPALLREGIRGKSQLGSVKCWASLLAEVQFEQLPETQHRMVEPAGLPFRDGLHFGLAAQGENQLQVGPRHRAG